MIVNLIMYFATITKNEIVSPTIHKISASVEPTSSLQFIAGQFVMIDVPDSHTTVQRAFSFAHSPNDSKNVVWYVKILEGGIASAFFKQCKNGDSVVFHEPQGHMLLPVMLPDTLIFIATSTGIAPYFSMLHELARNHPQQHIQLLFGCREESDLFVQNELKQFQKLLPHLSVLYTLSSPSSTWSGLTGRVYEHLYLLATSPQSSMYLCGNKQMIIDVRTSLIKNNYNPKSIKFEIFF